MTHHSLYRFEYLLMNYTKDLCAYISTFQKSWIAQCLLSYIALFQLRLDFFARRTARIKSTALIIFKSVCYHARPIIH
jgi:hypothetical protein